MLNVLDYSWKGWSSLKSELSEADLDSDWQTASLNWRLNQLWEWLYLRYIPSVSSRLRTDSTVVCCLRLCPGKLCRGSILLHFKRRPGRIWWILCSLFRTNLRIWPTTGRDYRRTRNDGNSCGLLLLVSRVYVVLPASNCRWYCWTLGSHAQVRWIPSSNVFLLYNFSMYKLYLKIKSFYKG